MLTFDGKPTSFVPGKETANKEPPTNKFVVEKLYKVHRQRINKMEPVVDCHVDIPDFLTNTSWKQITEQHRREVITKQNEVIYKRIAKAENTESLITSENRVHIKRVEHELMLMKRLKQMGRIRDILKVQRENEDLLVRIDRARPEYGKKGIKEWYRHHELFKEGRRSDPTAGHLGFRGMKGLFPKALPPMPSSNARQAMENRSTVWATGAQRDQVQLNSPVSRGNMADPNSPGGFSLESQDPMSVTMDGHEQSLDFNINDGMGRANDMLQSLSPSPIQTPVNKKSSKKSSKGVGGGGSVASEGSKKKSKKSKKMNASNGSSKNPKLNPVKGRERGMTKMLGTTVPGLTSGHSSNAVSNLSTRHGTPNTIITGSVIVNLESLKIPGYITIIAKVVAVPFTDMNVILHMLVKKTDSQNLTVHVRKTVAPYEIISSKQTPMDRVYEVVSTQGTCSIFSDSAIISDIAQMRESFNKMFKEIDEDGNGYLTFDEFMVLMKKAKLGIEQADLRKILMEADDNGNGVVEFEEFYPLILDMTLSYRTVNAARKIVTKRQAVIDEEVTRRMMSVNLEDSADSLIMKVASCDPKKSGVVRVSDLKRCLTAMAGPLNMTEDEIAMIQRILPQEGYARVQYTTLPDAFKIAKWTTCRHRMQEDMGSDIYKSLLHKCQMLDDADHSSADPNQKGTITPLVLADILKTSDMFSLNTIQHITLLGEANASSGGEGSLSSGNIDYHKVLPVISKSIELMLDPSMLRQRAELLNPELEDLSVSSLVEDFKHNKEKKGVKGSTRDTSSRLKSLFNMADINKDNAMSLKEFIVCIKAVKLDLTDEEITALFSQADTEDKKELSYAEFAFFFEKNLAAIERANHMKAVYAGLHDTSSTVRAVGGEAEQLQQLKDLEDHLLYVFKSTDKASTGKLEKNDIQSVLQQIDVALSPFQISTIMDEMFCDEEGFVQINEATVVCAHLLQVFLAEESAHAAEENAGKDAKKIVKLMERDIHRIVRFFVNGVHEIDYDKARTGVINEDIRNRKLELLVHSPHSGLCPTEANHLMHTLFNQAYRDGLVRSVNPSENESIIGAVLTNKGDLNDNIAVAQKRRESVMRSATFASSDKSGEHAAALDADLKHADLAKYEESGADAVKGRSARSSILHKPVARGTISGAVGAPNVPIHAAVRRKTVVAAKHWVPTEQELTDSVARAKKETIMRSRLQTLRAEAATKALLISFEHAKELLSMRAQVEPYDNYLPVRIAFEVLEDCLHFRINRNQIISLIVFSNCFDRTETLIEYQKFAKYAGVAIRNLHLPSEIEKRAEVIELISKEIKTENDHPLVKCNHYYDSLGVSEEMLDSYMVEEFLKVEDSRGEVSQEEFIRIICNIPGVVLTTKDAITVSAGFPHTPEGLVHWQKFVPWGYRTISALMLEHMIKRRVTIMELDTSTATQAVVNPEESFDGAAAGNSALTELINLAENASELLKIRFVSKTDEHGKITENVLALFPFDPDELILQKSDEEGEEDVVASLDSLSIEQGQDGNNTELFSAKSVMLKAHMCDPPKARKKVATPGESTAPRKLRGVPAADGAEVEPVQVSVSVMAVELPDFTIDRDLTVRVNGTFDYTNGKKGGQGQGQGTSFEVMLDCPLAMPSMCLVDPEAAIEFAASIPDMLIIEFTRGGGREPKLMLNPFIMQGQF